MNTIPENILDRIKKLLVLGTSSNPNEAENAMAAAHALMQKHRISVAEIEMQTGIKQENIIIDATPVFSAGRIPGWKSLLLHVISGHCGCASYKQRAFKHETTLRLVGRNSDIEMAKYMFAFAMNELVRLSDRHCAGKGHRYADSWLNGAVAGISNRLKREETNLKNECATTAMVLVDSRKQESDAFMRSQMNITQAKQSNSKLLGNAFYHGKYVGENNIDLSTKNKLGVNSGKFLK